MNSLDEFWHTPYHGPKPRQKVVEYFNMMGKMKTKKDPDWSKDIVQADFADEGGGWNAADDDVFARGDWQEESEIDSSVDRTLREANRSYYEEEARKEALIETRIQQLKAFVAVLIAAGVGWVVTESGTWEFPSMENQPRKST